MLLRLVNNVWQIERLSITQPAVSRGSQNESFRKKRKKKKKNSQMTLANIISVTAGQIFKIRPLMVGTASFPVLVLIGNHLFVPGCHLLNEIYACMAS